MCGSAAPTAHKTAFFPRCSPLSPVYCRQTDRATFEHNLKRHRAPANCISPQQLHNIFCIVILKAYAQIRKGG
jgi:hypothetical protein